VHNTRIKSTAFTMFFPLQVKVFKNFSFVSSSGSPGKRRGHISSWCHKGSQPAWSPKLRFSRVCLESAQRIED
jgi:hypothetical protein